MIRWYRVFLSLYHEICHIFCIIKCVTFYMLSGRDHFKFHICQHLSITKCFIFLRGANHHIFPKKYVIYVEYVRKKKRKKRLKCFKQYELYCWQNLNIEKNINNINNKKLNKKCRTNVTKNKNDSCFLIGNNLKQTITKIGKCYIYYIKFKIKNAWSRKTFFHSAYFVH